MSRADIPQFCHSDFDSRHVSFCDSSVPTNTGYGVAGLSSFQNVGEDFTFEDNVTKISGKHTAKFGYQLIRTRYNGTTGALLAAPILSAAPTRRLSRYRQWVRLVLLGTVTTATFSQEFASWLPRWCRTSGTCRTIGSR